MKRTFLSFIFGAGLAVAQDPKPPIEYGVWALQDRYMTQGPNGLEFPSVGIIFSVKCLGVPQGGGNYDLAPCAEHAGYRVVLFYQDSQGRQQVATGIVERSTTWANSWLRFNVGGEVTVTKALMQPLKADNALEFEPAGRPSEQRMAVKK
jgi:hypothetical protein